MVSKKDLRFHFIQTKLLIQIKTLGVILIFLKWNDVRWKAYKRMKAWDKWFATLTHMKEMNKEDRHLILQCLPQKDLEEAMETKMWTHTLTGEIY